MEFQDHFATEAACLEYLAASRWPDGFLCPACGGRSAWVLERRHLWECSACHLQTSVTAGTVMHGTRTPLRTWFWAAYLVATHHPGISAKQLQRQLALSRYETAWLILHKLRRAMVAPERGPLFWGEVEIDEFSLGGHEEGLKGSRQHGKKALVGAAVEVRGRGSGRLRLQILANSRATTLEAFAKATTAPATIVHTDGLFSYNGLAKLGYDHRPRKQQTVPAGEQPLPRVHRAISNLKAWMHGTHRGVSSEHLPVYLDEYVFRHTVAAPRWPPSRPSSASARCTTPRPTDKSRAMTAQPEPTGPVDSPPCPHASSSPWPTPRVRPERIRRLLGHEDDHGRSRYLRPGGAHHLGVLQHAPALRTLQPGTEGPSLLPPFPPRMSRSSWNFVTAVPM